MRCSTLLSQVKYTDLVESIVLVYIGALLTKRELINRHGYHFIPGRTFYDTPPWKLLSVEAGRNKLPRSSALNGKLDRWRITCSYSWEYPQSPLQNFALH